MSAIKTRKAWAIVSDNGYIHLDKIMGSPAEAWDLLGDEYGLSTAGLRLLGFRCERVQIKSVRKAKP